MKDKRKERAEQLKPANEARRKFARQRRMLLIKIRKKPGL
jgi:hypothetical protein